MDSVKKQNHAGFTLIELLVVIAVIGLLSSVVLVALNRQRIAARNTKRIADIKQLYSAFQAASSDANFPGLPAEPAGACLNKSGCTGWSYPDDPVLDAIVIPKYISQFPQDPVDPTRSTGATPVNGYAYQTFGVNATPPAWCPTGYTGGWAVPGKANTDCFAPGNYIWWMAELPYTPQSCGPDGDNFVWRVSSYGVECYLLIN